MNKENLDKNINCPEHGSSEWAKEKFWEKPLTNQWGCRCPNNPIGYEKP